MVLIFGMMMQQSVTDDVNEYYWTVEAEDATGEEQAPDVVLGPGGFWEPQGPPPNDPYCADVGGASNPEGAGGMWTWEDGLY